MQNEFDKVLENVVETEVEDETESEESVDPVQYEITSFGADYDAEGLVKRLEREDIYVPPFQRGYVWNRSEASRFIESLLLGLPVPGIFLAREGESKRLIVIDGQQRLKTLKFFFDGYFDPDPEAEKKTVFKLIGVKEQFEGVTYKTLRERDRIILNDSIIHATIVKQDSPKNQQSSIYHIFERLNTSGRRLSPQQIRVAIYHGKFLDKIRELNDHTKWREIFGKKSKTLKDQELILRFLAMYFTSENYKRPMNEFLNDFAEYAMKQEPEFLSGCDVIFRRTIDIIHDALGVKAFRPERALNAAVYDSVMVAMARRLQSGDISNIKALRSEYEELLKDDRYLSAISQSTSDDKNVLYRLNEVTKRFAKVS